MGKLDFEGDWMAKEARGGLLEPFHGLINFFIFGIMVFDPADNQHHRPYSPYL